MGPNGRVIMFTRETAGAGGGAQLFSVDISGRNLQAGADERGGVGPGMVAAFALSRQICPFARRLMLKSRANEPRTRRTDT